MKTVKVFIWDTSENISPLASPFVLSSVPAPLAVTGNFTDGGGSEIKFMEGKTGISGKLSLTAGEPPENLTATLKLMQSSAKTYENSKAITFENGAAELNIAFETNSEYPTLPALAEGDELVLIVTDGTETLFEKRLPYKDQSKIVDIILVAGQSNALGDGGDASLALKPADDAPVYRTRMEIATGANAVSISTEDGSFSDSGPLHSWDSALAKTWHEETGRTVLIVQTARGGTGFPKKPDDAGIIVASGSNFNGLWNPDNNIPLSNTGGTMPGVDKNDPSTFRPRNCYLQSKIMYNQAIASIDTNDYTIGRRLYFWNQGCNENSIYTPSEYETAFMELHNEFTTSFGSAADTGKAEDYPLEFGGILPVRSDYTTRAENSLFLTGSRIAQYNMASKQDDIFIVADAMEHWSSDANIKKWFEEKYASEPFYGGAENMPDSYGDIINLADQIHYLQYAHNELDRDLYDAVLTVNVTLPSEWASAKATQGGTELNSTISNGVLSLNLAPNSGNVTITKN